MSDEPIYSFAALRNRLTVSGELVAQTALRIGAGRASGVVGNDLPVLRDALGRPFIPGASLKGALRARLEALVRAVAPGEALDLLQIEDRMRTTIAELRDRNQEIQDLRRRRREAEADRLLSTKIWDSSTLIDLTFGAPWVAGRLFLKDALVNERFWFGQYEIRNGVALNRDTETVEEGLLYDYEVVPAATRFRFELVIENAADWQLGMVLLGLRPWERGEAQIGGFRSRGLGYVQLEDVRRVFVAIRPGSADDALRMFGYSPVEPTDTVSADDQRIKTWTDAFVAVLKQPELAREQGRYA